MHNIMDDVIDIDLQFLFNFLYINDDINFIMIIFDIDGYCGILHVPSGAVRAAAILVLSPAHVVAILL